MPLGGYKRKISFEWPPLSSTIDVILPVFLVLGLGYLAAWTKMLSEEAIDGLMRYAQNFATPILLFKSISALDLSRAYDSGLLLSFYLGALISFCIGLLGAIFIFKRAMPDAVAIGFACLFSNSLLLGLPITSAPTGRRRWRVILRSFLCIRPFSIRWAFSAWSLPARMGTICRAGRLSSASCGPLRSSL